MISSDNGVTVCMVLWPYLQKTCYPSSVWALANFRDLDYSLVTWFCFWYLVQTSYLYYVVTLPTEASHTELMRQLNSIASSVQVSILICCMPSEQCLWTAHGRLVTSSRQITEVKQRRARLVLGWVTAARVTLPAMCRGVGQASHITLPLSTQQWWVPGGTRKLNCSDWL